MKMVSPMILIEAEIENPNKYEINTFTAMKEIQIQE
jgi:hypothetical protein